MTRRGFFAHLLAGVAGAFVAKPVVDAIASAPLPPPVFPEAFMWRTSDAASSLCAGDVLWFPVGGGEAIVDSADSLEGVTVTWLEPPATPPESCHPVYRVGNAYEEMS